MSALPPLLRNELYKPASIDYAETWSEAKDYLRIEARRIE